MCAAVSVVRGEAAESDNSDEDVPQASPQKSLSNIPHGEAVTGEASESDDEQLPSMASSVGAHFAADNYSTSPKTFDSLLHKKLAECNISFYNSMMSVLRSTIQDSVSKLTTADEQLAKSHARLQRASVSLRSLEFSSKQLADRLSIAVYSPFIPKITIPIPDEDSD